MNVMHLTNLDLNLLRVFDVLLEERSVTSAGAATPKRIPFHGNQTASKTLHRPPSCAVTSGRPPNSSHSARSSRRRGEINVIATPGSVSA